MTNKHLYTITTSLLIGFVMILAVWSMYGNKPCECLETGAHGKVMIDSLNIEIIDLREIVKGLYAENEDLVDSLVFYRNRKDTVIIPVQARDEYKEKVMEISRKMRLDVR